MKQVVLVGNTGLSMVVFWCVRAGHGLTRTDMLNCVYCYGSEHEDPVLCVVA